jgi:hypothetical protein
VDPVFNITIEKVRRAQEYFKNKPAVEPKGNK